MKRKSLTKLTAYSLILIILTACSNDKRVTLVPSTKAELGFVGQVVELNKNDVQGIIEFSKHLDEIKLAYSDINAEHFPQIKDALKKVNATEDSVAKMQTALNDYQNAVGTIEAEWVIHIDAEKAKYLQANEKHLAKKVAIQEKLDEYYKIVAVEKKAYDEVALKVTNNKEKMKNIVTEMTLFVNKVIVDELMPVEKVTESAIKRALKEASVYPKGGLGYRGALINTEAYCPKDPNKKPKKVKRINAHQWCELAGFVELDGIDHFFSINVIASGINDPTFAKPSSENWKYLAKSAFKYSTIAAKFVKPYLSVKGGELYLAEKKTKKALTDKAQVALNVTGINYNRYKLLNRKPMLYQIEKQGKAIAANMKLIARSSSEQAKVDFTRYKLSKQIHQVKIIGLNIYEDAITEYLKNIGNRLDLTLGDVVSINADTTYVLLVGDVKFLAHKDRPTTQVSSTYFVPRKEGTEDEMLTLSFTKFVREEKVNWLEVFFREQKQHIEVSKA
jgi:hypothetical protein